MAIIICAIYLILLAIIMFILKLVFFKILSNTKLLIFFIVMIAIPFSLYKGCESCVRKIKNEFLQESTPVSFVSDNEGKEEETVSITEQGEDETEGKNENYKRVITFELKEGPGRTITKGDTIEVATYNEDGKIIEAYLPGKIVEWDDEWTRFTAKYDARGNRIEQRDYDQNGQCIKKRSIKYNANNKIIEEVTSRYVYGETVTTKYVAKYNDKGLLIEERDASLEGHVNYRVTYKYDEKGNQIEYCRYLSDNSLEEKTTNKYDDNGKVVLYTYSSEESSQKNTYQYDKNGHLAVECEYAPDNSLYKKKTFKYNDKGFVAEECIESNGEKTKYMYKRDDNGKELERRTYKAETTLESKEVYQYDANGKMTERCVYGADGKIKEKTTIRKDRNKKETIVTKGGNGIFESGELEEYEYFK